MCTFFLPQGVEIKLIFALQAAIFEIRTDFPNFHIWAWNQIWRQDSFYPIGSKLSLFFTLWAAVSEIRTDFQNCHIWAWNLAIGQSCTYIFFLPQGVGIELIFALRAAVSDTGQFSKNCHIWAWNFAMAKVPKVAHIPCILSFYINGSKLSLFSLYEERFLRYRPIFKTSHIWAWNLAIGQSCTYTLFLLQGVSSGESLRAARKGCVRRIYSK